MLAGVLMITASCQKDVKQEGSLTDTLRTDLLEKKALAYDYPIKPGTEAWKKLSSNAEKTKVCQIPEGILKQLTTEDLLAVCLAYPLLNDMYAFNNMEEGIDKLFSDFNGIRELAQRQDAINKFIEEYKKQINNVAALSGNYSDYAKGEYIVRISNVELLGSRRELLNGRAASRDTENFMAVLLDGYEAKKANAAYFKGIGLKTNLFSRAKVVAWKNNTVVDDEIKFFEFDSQVIDRIDTQSKQMIQNKY